MPKATNAANIGGFWIRRVAFPNTAVTRSRRLVRAEDIKENIPPAGHVGSSATWLRRQRMKRSPLPKWYPRTPLRDITAIYNALQRRRIREETVMAAGRANRDAESSPNSVAISEFTPTQNDTRNAESSSSSKVQHTPFTATSTITSVDSEAETERKLTESIDQIEKIVMKVNKKKKHKESDKRRVMQRKTLMSMR